MLNWKKIVPVAALILVIVWGFNPLLKLGLEKAGNAAFGAKTEIGSFSLNLFTGHLRIGNLCVANKNAPLTNLFAVARVSLGLDPEQLLYKRANIPAVTVDQILLGTPRKTSGALPAQAKKAKVTKASAPFDLDKMTKSLGLNPAALQDALKVTPPQSPAVAAQIQKENDKLLSEAQRQLAARDLSKELAALNLDELGNLSITSAEDLANLRTLLEEKQKGLTALAAAVEANQATADQALKAAQKNLEQLDQARRADLDRLMNTLNLANYDLGAIGRELLGPQINGWLDTGQEYLALAQKYLPPRKTKAPPQPKKERLQGVTVVFPNNKTRPRFWLGRLGLSGVGGQGTANELTYSGYVSDLASEQRLIGRPTVVDIKGAYTRRPNSRLDIQGIFDRRDTAQDSFRFVLSGFDLAGQKFWDTQAIPLEISGGLGSLEADIRIDDGEVSGKISFLGKNLRYAKTRPARSGDLADLLAEAVAGANELQANILLSGSVDAPEIRLTTNLDALIKARLEKEFHGKVEQAQAQLTAEYEKATGYARQEAATALHEYSQAFAVSQARQQAALDAEKAKLTAKQKELTEQIQGQTEAAKKQAEDALKKALPGLKF
ncbi:TIGR03545 family protein [Candidatus Termititenax persephonae]|uniref:TIGR03545 family protein n=1 Tax=Candidatus Termititenax persephonae TaxID=2218525 RepID=A0A388TJM5_9BACT|nr:TIGR03545 family protein [Candidatus Termititenax persephonae]